MEALNKTSIALTEWKFQYFHKTLEHSILMFPLNFLEQKYFINDDVIP